MEVILSGIVILDKPEQPAKAYFPMEVTPSGMAILDRLEQLLKARFPIEVMLFGSMMLDNPLHPIKAHSGIVFVHPNSILQPLPSGPALVNFLQLEKNPSEPSLVPSPL